MATPSPPRPAPMARALKALVTATAVAYLAAMLAAMATSAGG